MKFQKYILTSVLSIFSSVLVFAQKPTMVPKGDHKPLDFTQNENIIIYIVIPIVFLILYFIWRAKKRKDQGQ